MEEAFWAEIERAITHATGVPFTVGEAHSAGGGCIHNATIVQGNGRRFFVKRNRDSSLPMFEAEAEGLRSLRRAAEGGPTLVIPEPVCHGSHEGSAYLVLEHIDMKPLNRGQANAKLGEALAWLHQQPSPEGAFGFRFDNFIGVLPQENAWDKTWVEFWRQRRLEPQFHRAENRGLAVAGTGRLLDNLDRLLQGHNPHPGLLHGDLWGGNAAATEDGVPVVFDPAPYFGDRETDLAFTQMFGGFSPAFYDAYYSINPPSEGSALRQRLYNLYHELNHFNHFGGGYGSQAQTTVRYLLDHVP